MQSFSIKRCRFMGSVGQRSDTNCRYVCHYAPSWCICDRRYCFGSLSPTPPAMAQRFQQGNKKARHFAMAGLIEIALPRQLAAVVHIKLYWMSGVLYTVNLFHFQLDIRVDHIVGKHATCCQELAISIE